MLLQRDLWRAAAFVKLHETQEEETAEDGSDQAANKEVAEYESSFSTIAGITELNCRQNCHLKASQGK